MGFVLHRLFADVNPKWKWNTQKTISWKASTHEEVINNIRTRSISNRQSLTVLQIQIVPSKSSVRKTQGPNRSIQVNKMSVYVGYMASYWAMSLFTHGPTQIYVLHIVYFIVHVEFNPDFFNVYLYSYCVIYYIYPLTKSRGGERERGWGDVSIYAYEMLDYNPSCCKIDTAGLLYDVFGRTNEKARFFYTHMRHLHRTERRFCDHSVPPPPQPGAGSNEDRVGTSPCAS
jgi:hypothetical protein